MSDLFRGFFGSSIRSFTITRRSVEGVADGQIEESAAHEEEGSFPTELFDENLPDGREDEGADAYSADGDSGRDRQIFVEIFAENDEASDVLNARCGADPNAESEVERGDRRIPEAQKRTGRP